MQKNIIVLLLVAGFVNLSFAQQILPRIYEYDAAGNRIVRKVLILRDSALQKNVNNHDSADYCYEDDMDDLNILIYPNPTTSSINLHITDNEQALQGEAKIYNSSGAQLMSIPVVQQQTTVNMSHLPSGIYIIILNINKKTTQWKIIKQ